MRCVLFLFLATAGKMLRAYWRYPLENGERLIAFARDKELALVTIFFSTPKGAVFHTNAGMGGWRVHYIPTR